MRGDRAEVSAGLQGLYALETEAGIGGMAVVYRARDERTGALVAIKALRPELAGLVAHDRFLREIAILRELAHERVVPLLGTGTAGGVPYLVTPFLEGRTLRERIADAPAGLPLPLVESVARDVGEALDYAHERGIMHRDIKPENILLGASGAVVADFGLARAVEVAGGDTLSSSGMLLGTPQYMSPEQAAALPLSPATDLYALGCVLYEMLTGDPPFTGATAQIVLNRHRHETPPGIRVVRPEVPAVVEAAVLAALAKDPAARPARGAALSAAIAVAR